MVSNKQPDLTNQKPIDFNVGSHVAGLLTALSFFYLWPLLAMRDSLNLEEVLSPEKIALVYGVNWLVIGTLSLRGRNGRGLKVSMVPVVAAALLVRRFELFCREHESIVRQAAVS